MEKDRILECFDKIILLSVASICGLVLFFGLMGRTKIFFWTIDYSYISCVLLCSIAIHFILSIFGSFNQKQIDIKIEKNTGILENKIDKNTTNIIESLNGVEKKVFNTIKEVDNYVADRIMSAKFTVRDLNWQDFRIPTTSHSQQHRQEIDDEIDISIANFCNRKRNDSAKRKSIYEEIFTFPPSNKKNLQ